MRTRLVALAAVLTVLTVLTVLSGCAVRTAGTPGGTLTPAPGHPASLDCAAASNAQVVSCLSDSLSTFWTRVLRQDVHLTAVVNPSAAQVPKQCRAALQLHSAFSCPVDNVVYLTAPFLANMRARGPADQAWVRIASTMGHEMGHIVQFTVHEKLVEKDHPTWAQSREIEQQADCLAGVWSSSVGIPDTAFRAATGVVLAIVDSHWERRSHGTPAQRLAALERGQTARTPAACGIQLAR